MKITILSVLLFSILLIIITGPYLYFTAETVNSRYSLDSTKDLENLAKHSKTGIIFGAGTIGDQPNRILRSRLDNAGKLYQDGYINKVLISGSEINDHREVSVMRDYLIQNYDLNEADMILDGYGLRSYDTCKRAIEVYNIDKAVLITSGYHLPRVQFTCQKLGIDQIGVTSNFDSMLYTEYYLLREIFASHKAIYDLFIKEPSYMKDIYTTESLQQE